MKPKRKRRLESNLDVLVEARERLGGHLCLYNGEVRLTLRRSPDGPREYLSPCEAAREAGLLDRVSDSLKARWETRELRPEDDIGA